MIKIIKSDRVYIVRIRSKFKFMYEDELVKGELDEMDGEDTEDEDVDVAGDDDEDEEDGDE